MVLSEFKSKEYERKKSSEECNSLFTIEQNIE